jgi:hypothetical protein
MSVAQAIVDWAIDVRRVVVAVYPAIRNVSRAVSVARNIAIRVTGAADILSSNKSCGAQPMRLRKSL